MQLARHPHPHQASRLLVLLQHSLRGPKRLKAGAWVREWGARTSGHGLLDSRSDASQGAVSAAVGSEGDGQA